MLGWSAVMIDVAVLQRRIDQPVSVQNGLTLSISCAARPGRECPHDLVLEIDGVDRPFIWQRRMQRIAAGQRQIDIEGAITSERINDLLCEIALAAIVLTDRQRSKYGSQPQLKAPLKAQIIASLEIQR